MLKYQLIFKSILALNTLSVRLVMNLPLLLLLSTIIVIINGLEWKEVSTSAAWSARSSFSAIPIDNKMIITGGYNTTSIWSTSDGYTWKNLTSWTGITYRSCYPSLLYHDSIISMGGCNGPDIRFNDVWSSKDGGSTWNLLTNSAQWSSRCCFSAITYNDSIMMMGGHDINDYKNDVWSSKDGGSTWKLLTDSASWTKRDAYGVIVYNNWIYLMGGHDGSQGLSQWHNDVWKSNDGINWIQVTQSANWSKRSAFGIVVWNNYMVIMGGWHNDQILNDVWKSNDGKIWTQIVTDNNDIWSPRQWFASTTFNGNIYVLGGDCNKDPVDNQVWVLLNDTVQTNA